MSSQEKRSVYGAFRHVPGYMVDAAVRNRKRMMGFETSDYWLTSTYHRLYRWGLLRVMRNKEIRVTCGEWPEEGRIISLEDQSPLLLPPLSTLFTHLTIHSFIFRPWSSISFESRLRLIPLPLSSLRTAHYYAYICRWFTRIDHSSFHSSHRSLSIMFS